MPKKNIPPFVLPFGESHAVSYVDPKEFGASIDRAFPGLNGYDPTSASSAFLAKQHRINFPSLTVMASVIPSCQVDRNGPQRLTLLLPVSGHCSAWVGGGKIAGGAGQGGILIPEMNGRLLGDGDHRVLWTFGLDRQTLENTTRAMLGFEPDTKVDLGLDRLRSTSMNSMGTAIEPVLFQLGRLLDHFNCDSHVLQLLGYEDVLNRLLVSVLAPDLFATAAQGEQPRHTPKSQVLARLCDDMLANLGKKISLTDLEQKSGYSARALQYAFKNRFGCSPLEWLREQRLQQARQRLISGQFKTITQLAYESGFGHPSQFSSAYRARFGDSPLQSSQLKK